jgi:ABC-type phosphate transport system substrate-binding protein
MAQDGGTDGPVLVHCDTLINPIYLTGSTAFAPVVQAMGVLLSNRKAADGQTPAPFTLVYQSSGSCVGVGYVSANTTLTGIGTYYTGTSTAPVANMCDLTPSGTTPIKADVAISDVFYDTCGAGAKPATIGDFPGPVQAMLIIVPAMTTVAPPTAISAEEAADVWGCGANGKINPWTDEGSIMQRTAGSGTQNIIARHIGVLASNFHGFNNNGGGDLVTTITGGNTSHPVKADQAIGFLAADSYDTKRNTLHALAFRGLEQTLAYYADSSMSATDKRNVRDGHYLPWGYEHLITLVDANNKPVSAGARNFVDWVQGNTTTADNAPGFDPIDVQSANHVIPQCAMSVQRKSDGGYLSSYTPASGDTCNCFFEAKATGTAPASCTVCTTNDTCTGGKKCRRGYCE